MSLYHQLRMGNVCKKSQYKVVISDCPTPYTELCAVQRVTVSYWRGHRHEKKSKKYIPSQPNAVHCQGKHNLLEILHFIPQNEKRNILKSRIHPKCVVFEKFVKSQSEEEYQIKLDLNENVKNDQRTQTYKTAQQLVKHGAAVYQIMSDQYISVHHIPGRRFEPLLKNYIHYRGINETDFKSGDTPLHLCAFGQDTEHQLTLELLVRGGADMNYQNDEGITPLHLCMLNDKQSAGLFLLENGADINKPDYDGNSGVHYLVSSPWEYESCMPYIRDLNPDLQNHIGMTPLHSFYYSYCNLLRTKAERKSKEGISWDKHLIYCGANVNKKDKEGNVPIQMVLFTKAAKLHYLDALQLNIGAGLNIKFNEHFTSEINSRFFRYANVTNLHTFKLLLECGACLPDLGISKEENDICIEYQNMLLLYESYPLSLKRLSANVIRMSLMPNAILGVENIIVPTILKDYITFNAKDYFPRPF